MLDPATLQDLGPGDKGERIRLASKISQPMFTAIVGNRVSFENIDEEDERNRIYIAIRREFEHASTVVDFVDDLLKIDKADSSSMLVPLSLAEKSWRIIVKGRKATITLDSTKATLCE